MKHFGKLLSLIYGLTAAAMISAPAYAGVAQISIEIEDVINNGEEIREPDISISGGNCQITDIQWSKNVSGWKPGSKVTANLILTSDEGFQSSYNAGNCRIRGGNYLDSFRVDNNTLKVRITYIPRAQLGETEKAGWSSEKNHAVWKKVPFATAYQLRLYRDGELVKTLTVTTNTADLSEYMTQNANYAYQVRAMGETDAQRYYLLSGEYVDSEEMLLEDLGQIGGNWRNYQDGVKYIRQDGSSPAGQWEKISGYWYYFDANGYRATGWQVVDNSWYYMNQDGKMAVEWQEIEGKWYYLGTDGRMQTGWVQGTPGIWYYLYEDGSMAVNTVIDGQYPVDENGRWR